MIDVRNAEVIDALTHEVARLGISDGVIVSLVGAVDGFAIATRTAMRGTCASFEVVTTYDRPAGMSGTGEIVDGSVRVHAVVVIDGGHCVEGDLRTATATLFARAHVVPAQLR